MIGYFYWIVPFLSFIPLSYSSYSPDFLPSPDFPNHPGIINSSHHRCVLDPSFRIFVFSYSYSSYSRPSLHILHSYSSQLELASAMELYASLPHNPTNPRNIPDYTRNVKSTGKLRSPQEMVRLPGYPRNHNPTKHQAPRKPPIVSQNVRKLAETWEDSGTPAVEY
ncbi:hypothetical protein BZA77DRAFT_297549 [Pyronema omphalodes]|nr:hypothetical protein BZA77DRAFT_297549 [Pyronema omphalodes]